MKKQLSIFVTILIATVLFSTTAFAASSNNDIKVIVLDVYNNQTEVQFDVPPIIENGRTLVQMRPIFEALDYDVLWNPKDKTILASHLYTDGTKSKDIMQVGSNKLTYETDVWDNNNKVFRNILRKNTTMEVSPKIVNGYTMVPVRFVGQGTGHYVTWIPESRIIYLSLQPIRINGVTIQPEDTRGPEDIAADAEKAAKEEARNKPYSNPDVPQWALDAVNDYLKQNGLNGFAVGDYYDDEKGVYWIDEYKTSGATRFTEIGSFHVNAITKEVTHEYIFGLWDHENINDPYNPYNPNTKVPKEDRMKYIRYQEEHPEEYQSYLDELESEPL